MKPPDPSMTLDEPSSTAEARDATTLGLTLLWHPDLRRVGERAPLSPSAYTSDGGPSASSRPSNCSGGI